jgi:hypothetical protein
MGTGSVTPMRCSTWTASGAAWLTGRADGPSLAAPPELATLVERSSTALVDGAGVWGDAGGLRAVDPLALLGERAALAGLTRRGRTSCGGSTRLVPTADGWLAVSLPRDDDLALLPVWLGRPACPHEVPAIAAGRPTSALLAAAAELGLAIAALGEVVAVTDDAVVRSPARGSAARRRHERPLVVDLSSLWAGPLATNLLGLAGAEVVKVESIGRPDGLRRDDSGLFDILNAGKRSVALDFADPIDRRALGALVAAADVVVEASRPRALRQLGIDVDAVLAAGDHPTVWLSITAHGRTPPGDVRVGFGDDAAVAGGLVAWAAPDDPCFLADAVADPLTGLVAAAAVSEALATGWSGVLDLAMARVAACAAAGAMRPAPVVDDHEVARPRSRPRPALAAATLGAHTSEVLRWLVQQ